MGDMEYLYLMEGEREGDLTLVSINDTFNLDNSNSGYLFKFKGVLYLWHFALLFS